jgi:dTDP-4-dehydrorhamnose reductase
MRQTLNTTVGSNPQPARILLFGASGQVGQALLQLLGHSGAIVALNRADADLSRPDSLRTVLRSHRPNVVINAAAYTAVDRAEDEPILAHAINALAPAIIAEETHTLGATLVHYSTDYVFGGFGMTPYVETDIPQPLSVYGSTKAAGDEAVARLCSRHIILRTSWVLSSNGANFLKTILRLGAERETLRVVDDQCGAPTSAGLIADATARILESMENAPESDSRWGLYHLAAGGETNWYAYAHYATERAIELGFPMKLRPERIVAIKSAEYPGRARRPTNSRLDTSKARKTFSLVLPDWRAEVNQVLEQLAAKRQ